MPDATKVLRPRRRLWLLGALAFMLALVGLGAGSLVATIEGLPETKPSNASGSPSAEPSPTSQSAAPSPAPSLPDGAIAIPDVIGKRLPEADKILKQAGFTNIKLQDASGANRIVVNRSNWLVSATDPAGYTDSLGKAITLKVRKPTDGKGSQTAENGIVPDVTCKDLQDSQDLLKKAGFRVIVAQDASGKNRSTFFPRDWIVISQSERAGATPTAYTKITLRVIRFGEPVGDSGCES
jgi:PASTA domain-containing protein